MSPLHEFVTTKRSSRRPVAAEFTTGLTPAAGGPFESVAGLVRGIELDGRFTTIVAAPVVPPIGAIDPGHWGFRPIISGTIGGIPWDASIEDELTRSVRSHAPAIVHVHGLWDAGTFAAMRVLDRRPVPVVYSPRGMLEPWALAQRRLKKSVFLAAYLRQILSNADLLHATSDQERTALRRLGFRQPIAVIPNGIDFKLPPVGPRTEKAAGLRKLLYLGRLHAKKGLENLLHAWALARPQGWQLLIAGIDDGGYGAKLERLAADLGLNGDVVFKGPQVGLAKWQFLASGDAFVHPSFSENFGIAVAEAMAAGLPVIATVGTPWKVLADQGFGWWVEPESGALAEAITDLARRDAAELTTMGKRAHEYVKDHFAWDSIGEDMADCYGWLCGMNPVPACVELS